MALASCNYLAHVSGSTALMAINGNASYVNCGVLRTFLQGLSVSEGKCDLAIDFKRCHGLDSTVLGLIAKIAMDLSVKTPVGRVVLINLDGRNLDLVKNLGLQHVCDVAETPISSEAAGATALSAATAAGNLCDIDCLLEAHEALVRAYPENNNKFHDVIESLKAQL
jgi:hypothetical protein